MSIVKNRSSRHRELIAACLFIAVELIPLCEFRDFFRPAAGASNFTVGPSECLKVATAFVVIGPKLLNQRNEIGFHV
jgi:hypothetical protein